MIAKNGKKIERLASKEEIQTNMAILEERFKIIAKEFHGDIEIDHLIKGLAKYVALYPVEYWDEILKNTMDLIDFIENKRVSINGFSVNI